jgi:hypothetical protein
MGYVITIIRCAVLDAMYILGSVEVSVVTAF